MYKILFVCHGNICRSVAAEYIFKKIIKDKRIEKDFEISSAATSNEETGNDIYPPIKEVLNNHGIPYSRHYARQIKKSDLEYYDYIIAMEKTNILSLRRFVGESNKYSLLLDYTSTPGNISDPWFTRDFEKAYSDIEKGCIGLLEKIIINIK